MANESVESSSSVDATALRGVLGRFNDARCVLECAVRSLEQWYSLDEAVDEARRATESEIVCLRHAQQLLAAVYDDLDSAIVGLANAARGASEE